MTESGMADLGATIALQGRLGRCQKSWTVNCHRLQKPGAKLRTIFFGPLTTASPARSEDSLLICLPFNNNFETLSTHEVARGILPRGLA